MSYDYSKIISDYCLYKDEEKNFTSIRYQLLNRKQPLIYQIFKEIEDDKDLYDENKMIKQLRKKKRGNLDYLNILSYKFNRVKNDLEKVQPIEKNIDEIVPCLFIQSVIVKEIIDTLRRIQITETNKKKIRKLLGKLILNRWFTDGYLIHDSTSHMICSYIFGEIIENGKFETIR